MVIAVIFPVVSPAFVEKGVGRPFAKIDNREVFLRSVELYAARDKVMQRIVVVTPDDLQMIQEKYSAHLGFQGVEVAGGTGEWFGCVERGLAKVKPEIDTVIVHDPCRPAVAYTLLEALEEAIEKYKEASGWGGVVPVLPTRSGYADLGGGQTVSEYVEMARVLEVQSPQIFHRAALAAAYAGRKGKVIVDDAELVLESGKKIATIAGSQLNQRIDSDEMVRLGKDLVAHTPKPKPKTPLTPFDEAQW